MRTVVYVILRYPLTANVQFSYILLCSGDAYILDTSTMTWFQLTIPSNPR